MNAENREHAILSPSFMHIALHCAGSIGLKEKLPPSPSNPQSEKGTLIHKIAEESLRRLLDDKQNGFINPQLLSVYDIEAVTIANEWRNLVWKNCFEESITGKAYDLEDKLTLSEKFSIWGTADFWLVSTDERAKRYGFIADLKTGRIHVDEDRNPQLAAYACALRAEIRAQGKDLDYIKCAIYQPFSEGEKWRETKFTSKQLDVWEKKFFKLAEDVFSGKAKFKAGSHCKYCLGQAHCETYAKTLSKETSLALLDPKEFQFPEPSRLSDQVITNIVLQAKALDVFVKACKKLVFEKLYNGETLPNIKAVEGKARRKMDETQVTRIEKACAEYKVDPFNKKLKGIGELEKSLAFFIGNKDSKDLVDSFTVMGNTPISLVPMSDPRPAVLSKIELLNNIEIEE